MITNTKNLILSRIHYCIIIIIEQVIGPVTIFRLQTENAENYEYDDDEDGCGEVRRARTSVYRTHLFVRAFSMDNRPADVTLV